MLATASTRRAAAGAVLITFGLAAGAAHAKTITVPGAEPGTGTLFEVLQGAASPLEPGDVIELTELSNFSNFVPVTVTTPDITIRPAPGVTQPIVIDVNDTGSCITLNIASGSFTLEGITLRDGSGANGGGLLIQSATDVTITGCVFESNTATTDGGAIFDAVVAAGPLETITITGTRFEGNSAGDDGGAIAGGDHTMTLTDCAFVNNTTGTSTASQGGAVQSVNADLIVRGCTFIANDCPSGNGGGLTVTVTTGGTIDMAGCLFEGNTAQNGGAMAFFDGATNIAPTGFVVDTVMRGNIANGDGGAVRAEGSPIQFVRCVAIGNSAGDAGGAFFLFDETVAGDAPGDSPLLDETDFDSCLIAQNTAIGEGGGFAILSGPDTSMRGCTIADNVAGNGGGIEISGTGAGLSCSNTIIWGNRLTGGAVSSVVGGSYGFCNVEGGVSGVTNIDADPLFVDPENGDYRLTPPLFGVPGSGSPSIDRGDTVRAITELASQATLGGGVTFNLNADFAEDPIDLDGNPRVVDFPGVDPDDVTSRPLLGVAVDHGAFEAQPGPLVVPDVNGDGLVDFFDVLEYLEAVDAVLS